MALASTRTAVRSRPFGGVRPRPVVARAPARHSSVVVRAGLFDFLAPKQQAPAVPERARQLSEALIDVCSSSNVGSGASPAAKQEIAELVAELQQYSVKNPVRSPLLWGTYDVLYCSKPTAVGGPLKKGAGPVLAPGQSARQILQEPGRLINEVSFKTLGFLPGFSRQYGTIQPVSGDTFVLSITEGEINTGLGSQQKQFDINRKIQILYLDDTLRIVRFLPSELGDDEAEAAEGEEEEILFVFQRVAEQEEEEEEEAVEEEEEEEEEARPASPIAALFGGSGTRKVESLATQVERKVEATRTRKGTQPFFVGGRGRQEEEEEEEQEDPRLAQRRERERQQAEAQARKQREADERRAAAEKAKAEAAAAKEAETRARAAQEARERAEQEKAERAARAAAIREQLAELAEELKEKQAAAREAAKEAREVARENQATLKQVAAAEAAIAEAEGEVQQVSAALDGAGQARKAAEQALKEALAAVKDAEAAYKQAGAR